jgi:hypothetical protein
MAAPQFNFAERELDKWVRATLHQWAAHPETIPTTAEAWAADCGGPGSVPGLFVRLRLRKEYRDPAVGF